MVTPGIVEVGARVRAAIGTEWLPAVLEIDAVVVYAEAYGGDACQVGLQFAPLSAGESQRVEKLIDILLGLAPRMGVVLEDDDEVDDT